MIKNKIKETMKLSISLTKKHVFLISLLILLVGIGVVGATWANSNGVGHDWDELKPCASGQILESTGSGWACGTDDVGQGGGGDGGGWTDGGANVLLSTSSDRVGVGTSTPDAKLQIEKQLGTLGAYALHVYNRDTANGANNGLFVRTDAETANNYILDLVANGVSKFRVTGDGNVCINGDCKTAWPSGGGGSSGWTDSGSKISLTTASDLVGIGTADPLYKLEVAASTKGLKASTTSEASSSIILDATSGSTSKFRVNSDGKICIGTDCRAGWPSGGFSFYHMNSGTQQSGSSMTINCNQGTKIIGGGCAAGTAAIRVSRPTDARDGWVCTRDSSSGAMSVYAICADVD